MLFALLPTASHKNIASKLKIASSRQVSLGISRARPVFLWKIASRVSLLAYHRVFVALTQRRTCTIVTCGATCMCVTTYMYAFGAYIHIRTGNHQNLSEEDAAVVEL